ILQTRPRLVSVDGDAAGPQREELTHETEGLPHGGGGIEGPEVGGAVLLHAPGPHQARGLLLRGELAGGVVLVVPQADVVAGAVALDQVRLEDERFQIVAGDDELEVVDLADQGVRLRVAGPRVLEIGAHWAWERGGLPHIDDLALRVLVEIDPGPVRKLGELRSEVDGRYAPSHSVTTSTASPIAAGMSTVHRSIRFSRRSTGGPGRPGRGGFRKLITLVRTTRATESAAKKMSVHLMIMSARPLSGRPARPS